MLDRLHTELQYCTAPLDLANSPQQKLNSKLWNLMSSSNGINESNNSFKGKNSIVTSVFGGTLQSEVSRNIKTNKNHKNFLQKI